MPKFLVTLQAYRQLIVEADDKEDAENQAMEWGDFTWTVEEAKADNKPLDDEGLERALRHGAEEV
ncbi:hypothetical protein M1D96_06340 [Pseudomonas sp. D1-3]